MECSRGHPLFLRMFPFLLLPLLLLLLRREQQQQQQQQQQLAPLCQRSTSRRARERTLLPQGLGAAPAAVEARAEAAAPPLLHPLLLRTPQRQDLLWMLRSRHSGTGGRNLSNASSSNSSSGSSSSRRWGRWQRAASCPRLLLMLLLLQQRRFRTRLVRILRTGKEAGAKVEEAEGEEGELAAAAAVGAAAAAEAEEEAEEEEAEEEEPRGRGDDYFRFILVVRFQSPSDIHSLLFFVKTHARSYTREREREKKGGKRERERQKEREKSETRRRGRGSGGVGRRPSLAVARSGSTIFFSRKNKTRKAGSSVPISIQKRIARCQDGSDARLPQLRCGQRRP